MDKISVCTNYYNRLLAKQLEGIEHIFSVNPTICSPMDEVCGLDGVVKAAKAFAEHLESMEIIGTFEKDNQVVLEYLFKLLGVATKGVSIFTLTSDWKIERVNLFYDSHPFRVKREEIIAQ